MIDEEETYREFGYYSTDWALHSNKRIIAICDECGKVRNVRKGTYSGLCHSCSLKGGHLSKETRRRMSITHKGMHLPEWIREKIRIAKIGKERSEETRKKISDGRKGKYCGKDNSNWRGGRIQRICKGCGKEFNASRFEVKRGYGLYCSRSCARQHIKIPKHHTKPERIFEDICKKNNLPFKYTGDGTFWIHNINPDFIESNGKKVVVEVFGDYWHSPLLNYNLKEDRTLTYRRRIFKKYGFKLIVFWETDLLREDAEAFILKTLEKKI